MNLNEFVSFYSKSQVKAANGTLVTTRVKIADAYARTRPLSGRERSQSEQTESHADYRFYIHQRDDISGASVLVWNNVDYNIRFVANNGPKEPYMYIDAERGVAV